MKKIFISCIAIVTIAGVSTNKVKALTQPVKQISVVTCYDSQGQASGTGNTCTSGSGNCVANPCN